MISPLFFSFFFPSPSNCAIVSHFHVKWPLHRYGKRAEELFRVEHLQHSLLLVLVLPSRRYLMKRRHLRFHSTMESSWSHQTRSKPIVCQLVTTTTKKRRGWRGGRQGGMLQPSGEEVEGGQMLFIFSNTIIFLHWQPFGDQPSSSSSSSSSSFPLLRLHRAK